RLLEDEAASPVAEDVVELDVLRLDLVTVRLDHQPVLEELLQAVVYRHEAEEVRAALDRSLVAVRRPVDDLPVLRFCTLRRHLHRADLALAPVAFGVSAGNLCNDGALPDDDQLGRWNARPLDAPLRSGGSLGDGAREGGGRDHHALAVHLA